MVLVEIDDSGSAVLTDLWSTSNSNIFNLENDYSFSCCGFYVKFGTTKLNCHC